MDHLAGPPRRVAPFAAMADLLSRVVTLLGRTLTPEEVSEAIDAAFAQRPSQADMSALVATFSTPAQPRDHAGRYASHAPQATSGLTPERRRALLGGTETGRAILDQEDKAARTQGKPPLGPASPIDPERRRALLAATDVGRALLAAQETQARDQQRDYPHIDRMATDTERRQHLASTPQGRDILTHQNDMKTHAPWYTPSGHLVNHLTPEAYRKAMEATPLGRQILRDDETIMRAQGVPFTRPLYDGAPTPTAGRR